MPDYSFTMSSTKTKTEVSALIKELQHVLTEKKPLYTCGGRIPITMGTVESYGDELPTSPSSNEPPRDSNPVTIRWDFNAPPQS